VNETINGVSIEAYSFCGCGCGDRCNSPLSKFRPGHDQKAVSNLARAMYEAFASGRDLEYNELVNKSELFSNSLQRKVGKAYWALINKSMAAAAKKTAKIDAEVTISEVKIGRWTYPTKVEGGVAWRNRNRDGLGDWILLEQEVA
jgi:hypothetical protein